MSRTGRSWSLVVGIAPLVVVALAAGACTGVGSSRAEGGTGTSSAEDQRFLALAEEELVKRCIELAGFKYVTYPPPSAPQSYQWGRDDVEAARTGGYGLKADNGPILITDDGSTGASSSTGGGSANNSAPRDPNIKYMQSLPKDEQQRYWTTLMGNTEGPLVSTTFPNGGAYGVPTSGCISEARKRLYGSLQSYVQLTVGGMQIETGADKLVAADPTYVRASVAWQQCMKGKGYDFADIGAAYSAALAARRAAPDPAAAKAAEIKIAVADAQCGRQSGIRRIGDALDTKYQEQLRAQNQGAVLAEAEATAEAVARAKQILAGN